MSTHFLFPSHPLRPAEVEPMFAEQFHAFREHGFTVSLCPEITLRAGRRLQGIPAGATVVYRGWMMNEEEYGKLDAAVTRRGEASHSATGLSCDTSPSELVSAHQRLHA